MQLIENKQRVIEFEQYYKKLRLTEVHCIKMIVERNGRARLEIQN